MPPDSNQETWREVLSKAFVAFFLEKPSSLQEAARRVSVILFILLVGLVSYGAVKEPSWTKSVLGRPREERSITELLSSEATTASRVNRELEDWFYSHKPEVLALMAWDRLDEVTGLWVRPRGFGSAISGTQPLPQHMRTFAGSFMFGECGHVESSEAPELVLVACPVKNSYDVWGYIVATVKRDDLAYMLRSVGSLAARVSRIVY